MQKEATEREEAMSRDQADRATLTSSHKASLAKVRMALMSHLSRNQWIFFFQRLTKYMTGLAQETQLRKDLEIQVEDLRVRVHQHELKHLKDNAAVQRAQHALRVSTPCFRQI